MTHSVCSVPSVPSAGSSSDDRADLRPCGPHATPSRRCREPSRRAADRRRQGPRPATCRPRPPVADRAGTICAAWHCVLTDVESGASTEDSWRALVEEIHPLMLAWARHATFRSTSGRSPGAQQQQHEMDVEGIVQDAYVRLLGGNCLAMRRCRARTERQIRAYLRCVCENIATDRVRRRVSVRRGGGQLVSLEDWSDDQIGGDQPDGCRRGLRHLAPTQGGDDPEQRVIARRRLRRFDRDLEECARLGRHAERNAWIFRQAVIHGRRTYDIATEVDLRCSSIDSVVARLRDRLEVRGWTLPRRT